MSASKNPPRLPDKVDTLSDQVRVAFDEMPERNMMWGFVLLLLLAFFVLLCGLIGEAVAPPAAPAAPVVLVRAAPAAVPVWPAQNIWSWL